MSGDTNLSFRDQIDPRWRSAALLLTVSLVILAAYLAANRIYQVDEAQNLFMARVIGTHQFDRYFTNAVVWLTGPLALLGRSSGSSASLFFWGRMIFLVVFLVNLLLVGVNAGFAWDSRRGWLALVGAMTLAPLWDYGFEIRHDNLILLGLLLMWWTGRVRPKGQISYALLGLISAFMIFVAFKAFAFVLPLSLGFLVFPHPGHGTGRGRLLGAWLLGAAAGLLLVGSIYSGSGLWPVFAQGFRSGVATSAEGSRFGPGLALGRLPAQTPLLLGVSVGAAIQLAWTAWKERKLRGWESAWPEAWLFLGSLGVLLLNPTPFPYNLVTVVPFAYLLAFRWLDGWLSEAPVLPVALSCCVALATHVLPFWRATSRHFNWTNDRQELLMNTAESLTDPASDFVYDAVGMVPTRPAVGFHWYLHSLNIRAFSDGAYPSVSRMLQEHPASVLILNYRSDWLPGSDQAFIRGHYLPLTDDLWVLGARLSQGGGTYDVAHAGRYVLLGFKDGHLAGLAGATLDGAPLETSSPKFLEKGAHAISCPSDVQPVVAWVGPTLNGVPPLPKGDHLALFVNWY